MKKFLGFLLILSLFFNFILFLNNEELLSENQRKLEQTRKELLDENQKQLDQIRRLATESSLNFSMFRLYMTLYTETLVENLYKDGALDKEQYLDLKEVTDEQISDREREIKNDNLFNKMIFYPLITNMKFSENRYGKGIFEEFIKRSDSNRITDYELNNTNLGFKIERGNDDIGNLIFFYKDI